ncbi:M50 family metallopeptidase [Nesterenkonia pannonica]|uniref:M50 family metallopeptidase n=1 Tax=Nesterenkonia pannonica TaxID=1548602 RepID=UPI002164BDAC|nr:M50 family metallopeptidase [Nesterenkonia pannonica]
MALAWLALAGHAGAALTLYQAVVLLALLLSRNAVGILSCLVSVLVTGAIWWHNEPEIVLYTVVALAVFYGIAGLRATLDLWGSHLSRRRTSSGSDAAQAARAWRGFPAELGLADRLSADQHQLCRHGGLAADPLAVPAPMRPQLRRNPPGSAQH